MGATTESRRARVGPERPDLGRRLPMPSGGMGLLGLAPALLTLILPAFARAQDVRDADTLPKNVGGFIIQPGIGYGPGVQRFGRGWRTTRESLIADFNNINLTTVLAGDDGAAIENVIGGLGITNFQASQTSIGINFAAAYGITDRLTVAAFLPFLYASYSLDAWLTPTANQSTYGVKNPRAITCPGGEFSLDNLEDINEIIEDRGAGYEFNIGDLRSALISDCLDYKDPIDGVERGADGLLHGVGNRKYSGFRDLILGAKYQFYHGRHIYLAGIGYVIAPTGKVDDPRDLFDLNFGDGQWDIAFLGAVTIPIGRFRFAGSAGYEFQLADALERRLPSLTFANELEDQLARGELSEKELFERHLDNGTLIPVVTKYDSARVSRKLGDNVYVYSTFAYEILEWLSIGVNLDLLHHFRDRITSIDDRFGEDTPPYKPEADIRAEVDRLVSEGVIAEENRLPELRARLRESDGRRRAAYAWRTVRGQLVGGLSLNLNTLGPFLRNEFPLPLIAGISISRFIAGQNIDTPDLLSLSVIVPIPLGDVKDPAEYGFDGEVEGGLPWP